jgi:hypothetical protein
VRGEVIKGKARKSLSGILAAALALEAYGTRELLTALILFAALFVVLAALALVLLLVQEGGQRALAKIGRVWQLRAD